MVSFQSSLLIHLFLCMFCSSSECKGEDKVIQPAGDVTAAEGDTVTLGCTFQTTDPTTGSDYFFWYRQYPGKPPELLISHTGTGAKLSDPVSGLRFHVSDDKKGMDLQISSAAVTDSAVYYCALRPTATGNSKTLYKNLWKLITVPIIARKRNPHAY
uniref:Ig-like domain-containing protein n=1 Tax=Amphilophus citrinellus TaxID=61819 RepID=A0A3Q0RG83_AMPCI